MAKIRGEEESGVTQTNGVATGRTEVSRTNTPGFFQMENGGQHWPMRNDIRHSLFLVSTVLRRSRLRTKNNKSFSVLTIHNAQLLNSDFTNSVAS